MKKILFQIILASIIGLLGITGQVFAQTEQKIYSYDSIDTNITINQDSTFTVEERQLFDYQSGVFHQGWRSIPLDKVSRITDISVVDGATGQPLQYSARRLDKNDPDDWGRYTYYIQEGNINIEWYYNLSNTKHLWILRYIVHGGLEFNKESDRLYWNIFTDYDVPVKSVSARVVFPVDINPTTIVYDAYRSGIDHTIVKEIQSGDGIYFTASNISPREAFTIDVAFPKNIVQKSAFWKEWISANYGYVGSALLALLGIIFLGVYWYHTERHGKGRGVIIAQYEPPQRLHPAMAEVLIKETISTKTWPATIVDLAVRGYVRVVEEDTGAFAIVGRVFLFIFLLTLTGFVGGALLLEGGLSVSLVPLVFVIVLLCFGIARSSGALKNAKQLIVPKSYRVEKVKEYTEDAGLEDYEKKFLDIIFAKGKDHFSVAEMKKSPTDQRVLSMALNILKQSLYEETDKDTNAFEKKMGRSRYFGYIVAGLSVLVSIGVGVIGLDLNNQLYLLIVAGIGVCIVVAGFILFEPRLSHEGHLLREDWLGFKLYLETAERYRLQNLTPELFEKHLPYAMIFGIEKKWAKSFATVNMIQPTWYGTAHTGAIAGASSSASFSPVAFSSSFSSSFTSAFASSGGGGGGGSAGGGGGGGGGGAS